MDGCSDAYPSTYTVTVDLADMVVGDLYRYPGELLIFHQLLNAVRHVCLDVQGLARLAADHNHVRLLAHDESRILTRYLGILRIYYGEGFF